MSLVGEAFEEMMMYPAAAGNFSSHPDEKVLLRAIELSASSSKSLFINGYSRI